MLILFSVKLKNQYKNEINSEYVSDVSTKIRWERTLHFVGSIRATSGLDIGDRTPLTKKLEAKFSCKFESTKGDLDEVVLKGKYQVITCFEVVEHLFNPLHLLLQCKNVLSEEGILYLSMPTYKPAFLWSQDHFHEMTEGSFSSLLERSGFEIKRKEVFKVHPWSFYFTGFRPLLRGLFDRRIICELRLRKG